MFHFGQQLCGFVLKLSSLCHKVLFRILSSAVFEVPIAQILIELLLAVYELDEPCLLPLAREGVLGPEGVEEQGHRHQAAKRQSKSLAHDQIPPSLPVSRRMRSRSASISGVLD